MMTLTKPKIPETFPTHWPGGTKLGPRIRRLLYEMSLLPGQRFDLVVAATGGERIGKSTLCIQVLTILDPRFGLDQVTFRGPSFVEMGRHLGPKRGRLWDEGPFSRDAMTTDSKETMEHLFRCGQLYLFNAIIKPNLNWMEGIIAKHRAAYWFLVTDRGQCIVHKFQRADYPGAKPSWRKLFTFPFPDYQPPWMADYEAMKKSDLFKEENENLAMDYPAAESRLLQEKFSQARSMQAA